MSFLNVDPRDAREAQQLAQLGPLTEKVGGPAPLEGLGEATLKGIGRGLTGIYAGASTAAEYVSPAGILAEPIANLLGAGEAYRDSERKFDAAISAAMDATRLDPGTVGAVGGVVYGVGSVLVPGVIGAALGGPVLGALFAGGSVAPGTYHDLRAEGVTHETALHGAAIEGFATTVGFALPAGLGGTVLTRVGSGAAINVGAGAWERGAMSTMLETRGYADLAERYQVFDGMALGIDAVLGAAFGGISAPRVSGARPSQAHIDAALTANAALQAETSFAIPANDAARASHIRAQEQATEQMLRGERVSASVDAAGLIERPAPMADEVIAQAFRESGLPGLLDEIDELEGELARRGRSLAGEPELPRVPVTIPRAGTLKGLDAAIEERLAREISADLDGAVAKYGELEESEGGKVLNTDTARELSAEYRADRTRSAAVHEPASWLVKEMYRRKLREAPRDGEVPLVLFTGGGTGAGKSSALENIPEMQHLKSAAQIIYDTNMNGFDSSRTKIDQALEAGKKVHIAFVLRDPVEALVKGALPRAERMGRTVPLAEHAKTHQGAAETLPRLAAHYANDPRVSIGLIDNTRGKGKAAEGDIALAATFDYSNVKDRLRAALDKEYQDGKVSEAVYRGTAGQDAAAAGLRRADAAAEGSAKPADAGSVRDGFQGVRPPTDAGHAQVAKPQDVGQTGLDTVTAAILADTPDLSITSPDGQAVPANAALSDADRMIANAEQDAPGFEAAVSCFLRRGA